MGSQEETRLSLSACNFQMLAVLTNSTNSTAAKMKRKHPGHEGNPLTQAALVSGSCSGVQLCPGGSYCKSLLSCSVDCLKCTALGPLALLLLPPPRLSQGRC